MEGLFRGPRRARRVAQNAAARRTPEAGGDEASGSPQADLDPQLNATQQMLMDYYEERRSSQAQTGTAARQLSPQNLAQGRDHPIFQTAARDIGVDVTPDHRQRRGQQTTVASQQQQQQQPEVEDDEYTSPEDLGDVVDDDDFDNQTEDLVDDVGEQLSAEEELEQEEEEDEEEEQQEGDMAIPFDPKTLGLKEISNLGKFTVSSHKPGNGVEELRSDDMEAYWQSDGPQPHNLTVYFIKRVGIRDIRYYVDHLSDESYTPTKVVFKSGTSENNLIEFGRADLVTPVGWQQVPIAGAGGGPDGNTLVSYVFQMQILENRQNGKDTHLRGIKIYAADSDARGGSGGGGGTVHGAGTVAEAAGPAGAVETSGTSISSNALADMVDMIDIAADQRLRRQCEQGLHPRSDEEQEQGEFVTDDDPQLRMRQIDRRLRAQRRDTENPGMGEPDFMRDPEIR